MDSAGLREACISPDQDLAGFGSTEAAFSGGGKTGGVSRVERARRFEVHPAAGR